MKKCGRLFLWIFLFLSFLISFLFAAASELIPEEKEWLSRGSRLEREGWIYLHLEGKPFERGFQHGYLLAREIEKAIKVERHMVYWTSTRDFNFFAEVTKRLFDLELDPELKAELRGMAAGMEKAGVDSIGYSEILAHNAFTEIYWYWWPWAKKAIPARLPPPEPVGCSAFIATGSYTADSGIVMAHNSWVDYAMGGSFNVIMDLQPEKGHRILMQTLAGNIHSVSDFFVSSSGIIGTETTIADFTGTYDTTGTAEFARVRLAMQYAGSIDEWAKTMIDRNSGGYANSWLLGDIRTGEIARLELGTKFYRLEKKKDGYFIGANIAEDHGVLFNETGTNFSDVRSSNVARKISWQRLMKIYQGRINIDLAKEMLADHYDAYLGRDYPGPRSICGHNELADGIICPLSSRVPFFPSGALDGKVVDKKMAEKLSFLARWGSSCGRPFQAEQFLAEHPQYEWLRGFMDDRPARNWTQFGKKE